jgi:polysaccharide export outer membrane protein
MPVLGKLKVAKLTARELKDSLTEKVKTYLKDPIVDVSFTSFKITVLGEVRSPGTFSLDMQRTTLFEGLAAAGDLMHSARRHNVHLYRDYNGKRTITKLDLRQSSLLYDKSLFQLKPNDVLYVQARPGSIFQEDFGLIASIVSIVVSVVTLGVAVSK